MQMQYNKATLYSGNMYQIFTYVKNQDAMNTGNVSGMLLYAKTEESITPDCSFVIGGNKISVKTLDLNKEFNLIAAQLALQETDNSLILVSQQLDILIGLDENLLLKPDTTLLDQTVSLETYEDYVAQAYSNDPAIRLLRKQTELAQNDIRLTKASSLPSLSLYASNTLARPVSRTLADMYNNNWNIGLSLSYPLSSLYKNNHKIKESKWMVSLHKNEEEQKKQKIRMEVRTAFLRHKEALQEVEALKLSVRQAQENYRIMQNRYLNQLAILTDLLDANSVLLNAELQLTNARTHVIYTYYQLQKACGRL